MNPSNPGWSVIGSAIHRWSIPIKLRRFVTLLSSSPPLILYGVYLYYMPSSSTRVALSTFDAEVYNSSYKSFVSIRSRGGREEAGYDRV